MTPHASLPGLERAVVRARRSRRGAPLARSGASALAPAGGSLLDRLIDERAPAPDTSAADGRLRLDDVIVAAWEDLLVDATTSCPVCGGAMAPSAAGQDAAGTAGACRDCGTTLA